MSRLFEGRGLSAAFAVVIAVVAAATASRGLAAPQLAPQAVNLAALVAYPSFYADRLLVVRGAVHDLNGRLSLEDDQGHRVVLASKSQDRPDGVVDVTGTLVDLGRSKPDDVRLAGYDLSSIVGSGQDWPRPGDLYVFLQARFTPAETAPPTTTIRSLLLEGGKAVGRQVTVTGQFRGRNLFGDLPRSPGISRWDFVIRSADASIWVTGMQPRGKDFEFDPDHRVDSNRWLQVMGTVREDRGLMLVDAKHLALSDRPKTETADGVTLAKPVAPAAPPEVLFSVPAEGETGVSPTATVRIQLSRSLDRSTVANHIRVGYLATPTAPAAGIASNSELDDRNNAPSGAVAVLIIQFPQPLERFRTVRIDLLEGIKAADGQPLKPWSLSFTVGQ